MTDQTGAPARRLTAKGQATRERILTAAVDLIAARGVAGTSTEDVRKAAGIGGSQLYHYFDSKHALIAAVITRQADAEPVPGQAMLGNLDSFGALRAWADAAVARQETDDFRGGCTLESLTAELSAADDVRADLRAGLLRWQGLLVDSLAAMRERGELHADADLDHLAYALLAALQGGSTLSQATQSTAAMRAGLDAALAYVESYAVTPPAPVRRRTRAVAPRPRPGGSSRRGDRRA